MSITIEEMAARVRSIPTALRAAAPEVLKAADRALREDLARGTTPGAGTWASSKKGKPTLTHAADAIKFEVIGTVGRWSLGEGDRFYYKFHQTGVPGHLPARPMLPVGSAVPEKMRLAITIALGAAFQKHMTGGGR